MLKFLFRLALICILVSGCTSDRNDDIPVENKQTITSKYTVKKGDTLMSIGRETGISWQQIAKMNNISAPYNLQIGQTLVLDGQISATTKPNKPKKEVVKKDTEVKKSNFNWEWPVSGKILVDFSQNSTKGVNIMGELNSIIKAAASGQIVYAGNALSAYGELVIIKHDDNFVSAYAHNNNLLVKEGQKVKIGDKIATMGKSPENIVQLHFEIRYNGEPMDPLKYLPKK